MKKRRVVIQIEIETDISIKDLKETIRDNYELDQIKVIQIQANVIKKEK